MPAKKKTTSAPEDNEEKDIEEGKDEGGSGEDIEDMEGQDDEEQKPKKKIPLPKDRWHLNIEMEEISQELSVVDLEQLFGSYLIVRRKFFDDLLTKITSIKHYSVGKGIGDVTGVDGQDWTKNSWFFIMAKEMKNNSVFWMLLKREQDLSSVLVAIGPDEFAESVNNLFQADPEARYEYLKKILIWLTIEPAKWKNVGIFIPNWF
ncbi:MAG: hypothetical protein ACTSUE_04260 [Promethearchaeota archaeon]